MGLLNVQSVRFDFADLLREEKFVVDKTGVKVLEIVGAAFVADENTIFGALNEDYAMKELSWYRSKSLSIYTMDNPPEIWKKVADNKGFINSNYGWCVWHYHNYNQYYHVLTELLSNPQSRRAVMIYTRPSMWEDYNVDGRSDFMCTNAVQYLIRDGKMHSVVQMRSNDVTYGFKNDFFWQKTLLTALVDEYNSMTDNDTVSVGDVYWNAGSLHVYERDFYLVNHFDRTGETNISKMDYLTEYGESSRKNWIKH